MALSIGNDTIVEFGTVKKSILKHFDIKQEVFYADFNWNAILKLISLKLKFTEISKYQEVRRDLSLLIDESVSFESIYKIAKQSEKNLLKEVDLFDVYQGKNLPDGKKSYALSFILQDNTKTLTDDQIDGVMIKLQKNLEKELNVVLR
jgi:phenylalanyl-tRNA synthetase beta chain